MRIHHDHELLRWPDDGFTMLELMIVLGLLAIAASLVLFGVAVFGVGIFAAV
jgi:prepilin-type N-terminal cleavage/methylation domain-containing protein